MKKPYVIGQPGFACVSDADIERLEAELAAAKTLRAKHCV